MLQQDESATGAPSSRAGARAVPTATNRIQLGPATTFATVAAAAPYLASLGVSHVYLSPVLQAVAGSAHGYDVVDHGVISEALGGAAGHAAMSAALASHGIGQVIDIVPNHMALETSQNHWWRDLLRHGPASRYAPAFDVVWRDARDATPGALLLPVLGEHYGELLRRGEIRLAPDGVDLVVQVGADALPTDPRSWAPLYRSVASRLDDPAFEVVADALDGLPDEPVDERAPLSARERACRGIARLLELLLADPRAGDARRAVIEATNADVRALDALLERQHYRLVPWRSARHELDHRRFFDVTGLIGLRMDRPTVFAHTHRVVLDLVRSGAVDGLRVDHVDGLRRPAAYLAMLTGHAPDAWIVVEKILAPDEELPAWPVAGTTGYEVLHEIQRVLVPADAAGALGELARSLTGEDRTFDEVALDAKHHVLRELLAPELERVVDLAVIAARADLAWRDVTRSDLLGALAHVLCAMPVYRTYLADGPRERDVALVAEVVRRARIAAGDGTDAPDPLAFDAVHGLLVSAGDDARAFAARFEQVSGALMAKGVEDTAFYRYPRLLAANEVGGDPAVLSMPVAEFHARQQSALAAHPDRMVTTSTHDTKRSEDVRARLLVLADRTDLWAAHVATQFARDAARRATAALDAPTRYFAHQTLVGAHPLTPERLHAHLVKAAREAKLHTSWLDPDLVHEATLAAAVDEWFADAEHRAELEAFVARVEPWARTTSLAQVVLRNTVPGVPDVYQGNEDVRLRLVDPDNRDPVDFAAAASRPLRLPDGVLDDGAKRWVTARTLGVRRERPGTFRRGAHRPVHATGERAEHLLAFTRGDDVLAAVTRLPGRLDGDWRDTAVALPPGRWSDVLAGVEHEGAVEVRTLFARLPVALLVRAEHHGEGP